MDLIVQSLGSSRLREDVCVINPKSIDMAIGSDENDFEVTIDADEYKRIMRMTNEINFIYYANSEWGGIVDNVSSDTASEEVSLSGRTWSGVMEGRIIKPESGADYYSVSGSVSSIMSRLITKLSLGEIFEIGDCSPVSFSYRFERYCGAYSGISKMLGENGLKLLFKDNGRKVRLSVQPISDYSELEEWSGSQMDLVISRLASGSVRYVYMICLGEGELKDRMVVYLRLNLSNGSVTKVNSYTPVSTSYEVVYDYANAESEDDLIEKATEKLREIYEESFSIKSSFESGDEIYDIGDLVGARDEYLGIQVIETISKKILNVDSYGDIQIECQIGGA